MTENIEIQTPCVVVIGALDPTGGAGLLADARAIAAFGGHTCPVATAVTAQNTRSVQEVEAVAPETLAAQIDVLLEDIAPDAVKIGLLPGLSAIEIVATRLRALHNNKPDLPIILDAVFSLSDSPSFMDEETILYISGQLLRLCDIVTLSIPEAELLSGLPILGLESMAQAAVEIYQRFGVGHVLVKSGQGRAAEGAAAQPDVGQTNSHSADIFFDGERILELRARDVGYRVRGTGCLLASALAAQRARGIPAPEAMRTAKVWLTRQLQTAQPIGGGQRIAV